MENTLPAFQRALELGADALELDVHVTVDGAPVVHHDPCLGRESAPIHTLTLEQIEQEGRHHGKEVPTLRSVLALAGMHQVYVELKGSGSERATVQAIRESGAMDRCVIHSFDHRMVLAARMLERRIPGGILLASYLIDIPAALQSAGARDLWMWWELIDEALIDTVHQRGGRVIAWTVNAADAARKLATMRVDGICTDDIPLVRAACRSVHPA